jgi:hypothetical protein
MCKHAGARAALIEVVEAHPEWSAAVARDVLDWADGHMECYQAAKVAWLADGGDLSEVPVIE